MSVPDLARLAAEAAQGPQDPWALMVGINQPDGRAQQVPVSAGVFLMLDGISAQLKRIADELELLRVSKVASG